MKKVTQSTLASELQISRNTVARALNNHPSVAESTRKEVFKKAEELGYLHPGIKKADFSNQQGNVILFSCPTFLHLPFWIDIIEGFESYFANQKITIQFTLVSMEQINLNELPDSFSVSDAMGIAFIGNFDHTYCNLVRKFNLPSISYDLPSFFISNSNSITSTVTLTNTESVAAITERIISKGHKIIAFAGRRDNPPSFEERYQGFKSALENKNVTSVDIDALMKIDNKSAVIDVEALHNELSNISNRPSAYVCVNDETATNLLSFKKNHPELMKDTIITGFDNLSVYPNQSELDATVETNPHAIGKMMAIHLHMQIKEQKLPNCIVRINATPIFNERLK